MRRYNITAPKQYEKDGQVKQGLITKKTNYKNLINKIMVSGNIGKDYIKALKLIDKEFEKMTETLKTRDKTDWKTFKSK